MVTFALVLKDHVYRLTDIKRDEINKLKVKHNTKNRNVLPHIAAVVIRSCGGPNQSRRRIPRVGATAGWVHHGSKGRGQRKRVRAAMW